MDHQNNGISRTEISSNDNNSKKHQYLLFIKRTLQFLLPVSLASFLLSYTTSSTSFFIFFTHFRTLVFPLLTHAFERKYMFLICNGILAFLVKTLRFNSSNSSSLSVLDDNDSSAKISQVSGVIQEPDSEFSPEINVNAPGEDHEEEMKNPTQVEAAVADADADADADDELRGEPNIVSFAAAENELGGGQETGDFIIESEELEMLSGVEEEEEDMEEGGGALADEQEMDVMINMDTEELNKKFEEFIRKTKEELRIQEQRQQLISVL